LQNTGLLKRWSCGAHTPGPAVGHHFLSGVGGCWLAMGHGLLAPHSYLHHAKADQRAKQQKNKTSDLLYTTTNDYTMWKAMKQSVFSSEWAVRFCARLCCILKHPVVWSKTSFATYSSILNSKSTSGRKENERM